RRMDAPPGKPKRHRRHLACAHPEYSHRRGHGCGLRHGLRGLRALRLPLRGIVALATLAAALLHGPALAGIGLVGAYVTPLLVSTGHPNYWALYIYLI